MAKGQNRSAYQEKVIRRYYEHRDTIALQRLGEIVSDLYLCEGGSKADRLWKRAEAALQNSGAHAADVQSVLRRRDVKALAQLVNQLATSDTGGDRKR